ncbi:hypothetical protein F0562_020304 [Nyssa sinensis]|uniref:Magnesium transporter n=1 Tax=Nyssa sinensis TaxID=561372 RepID=A0A5J5BTX8_9ASTE|nr:hypothetical protein F0562_020304 [Nyssa sinensis]
MQGRMELNRSPPPMAFLPGRRKGAATRTWLVVSQFGSSRVEELGKQPIMSRTGISANDLRVLEPELSYPSTILRRERAIVVNLESSRAIITANEILVPNPNDPTVASFVSDLECKLSDVGRTHVAATMGSDMAMEESHSNLQPEASDSSPETPLEVSNAGNSKPLPFEFRALEICLESVCKILEFETSTLEKEAYPVLDELSAKTSTHNLQRVRVIKGRSVGLSGRVQKVRDELEHLLDDDMHMADMYLTEKLATQQSEDLVPKDELGKDANAFELNDDCDEEMSNKSSTADISNHKPNIEELEMLLGAYFVQMEGILNKLSTLREYVHDTEDYVNIILDGRQNQLLHMGILISSVTFVINIASAAGSVMAMNVGIALSNVESYTPWYLINAGIIGGCLVLYVIALLWSKKSGLLG